MLAAAAIAFAGCSAPRPMLGVLRGNLAYARGDYQRALVHYLSSGAAVHQEGWVAFNMGNVYYALGEQQSALLAWEEARSLVESEAGARVRAASQVALVHAASYNRGVLLFERGQFRDAYEEFRYALGVDRRSRAAKVNLELALGRIRAGEQARQQADEAGRGSDGSSPDAGPQTLRILEYVRRKEAQRWYAGREASDPSDPRDW